jgi:hypothetical protein
MPKKDRHTQGADNRVPGAGKKPPRGHRTGPDEVPGRADELHDDVLDSRQERY